ncbi:MAG: hypothetical protein CMB80_03505 [Flammeovirgaceae bacterium]|nr:hypothetical protein [Flammeovirgaceae bacterium]
MANKSPKQIQMESVLSSLSATQKRLKNSGFERTTGLRQSMGDDCPYYLKSLNLFFKNDLVDLKHLLIKLVEEIDALERS